MKRNRGSLLVKGIAIVLVMISFAGSIVGTLGLCLFGAMRYENVSVQDMVYSRLLDSYAYEYLWDDVINTDEQKLDALEGGPSLYALTGQLVQGDRENKVIPVEEEKLLYGDKKQLEEAGKDYVVDEKSDIYVQKGNLPGRVLGESYAMEHDMGWTNYSFINYAYEISTGLFYGQTDYGYVPLLQVEAEGYDGESQSYYTETFYYDVRTETDAKPEDGAQPGDSAQPEDDTQTEGITQAADGIPGFYSSSSQRKFSLQELLEKKEHLADGKLFLTPHYYIDLYEFDSMFEDLEVNDGERVLDLTCISHIDENLICALDTEDIHIGEDGIGVYTGDKEPYMQYHLYVTLDQSKIAGWDHTFSDGTIDYFGQAESFITWLDLLELVAAPMVAVCIIVLLVSIILLMCQVGYHRGDAQVRLTWFDRLPYIFIWVAGSTIVSLGACGNVGLAYIYTTGALSFVEFMILTILCYVLWMLAGILWLMTTGARIKARKFWRYTLIGYLIAPFGKLRDHITESRPLNRIILGVFWVVTAVELIVFLMTVSAEAPGVYGALFVIWKAVEFYLLLRVTAELNQLKLGGERVANGDYSHPIDTSRMHKHFKEHGDNINNVGQGISKAVEEQMKSERFKTELITNVSHDIKTPLTSIINYVDLIKKENVTDPTLQEYVEVLDRQSNRLKKLIEDLIEASKASTGALSVNMEPVDAAVILDQVVGEFREKLEARGLSVVVNAQQPPVMILADGRHLWRVMDNLMGNIAKYTQTDTRVYIDMKKEGGWVQMTFRNISREQLNISSQELMERFVRGDSSRNTEGHGLGLNIAQSLTKLMGGNLHIEIDGDLFKVKLFFREYREAEKTMDEQ